MKIGMITDSLGGLSFDEMLKASAELGLETLEFACGNWSSAPHLNLTAMLASPQMRAEFSAKVRDHGMSIAALNCSGNPLHPGPQGAMHHQITLDTIRLANLMGIDRVVMMSGLPGGPGDANPNWIITDWPPECLEIQDYQWEEKLIPYWRDLVAYSEGLRDPQAMPGIAWPSGGLQRPYADEAAGRRGRDGRRQLRPQPPDVDECRSLGRRACPGRCDLLCPCQGHPHRSGARRHRWHAGGPRRTASANAAGTTSPSATAMARPGGAASAPS